MRSAAFVLLNGLLLSGSAAASSSVLLIQQQNTTQQKGTNPTRGGGRPATPPVAASGQQTTPSRTGTLGVVVPSGGQRPTAEQRREALRQMLEQRGQAPAAAGTAPPVTGAAGTRAPAPRTANPDQPSRFEFRGAALDSVVDSVMRTLGLSYVIDPRVSGTVNISTMREVPKEQLLPILGQLLKMNGAAIIKQEELYLIVPMGEAPRVPHELISGQQLKPAGASAEGSPETVPPGSETPPETGEEGGEASAEEEQQAAAAAQGAQSPPAQTPPAQTPPAQADTTTPAEALAQSEGVVTYVVPLNYVSSTDMLTMVQVFVSGNATIVNFQPANTLLITDYPDNLEQVLEIIDMLDTQYFRANTVDLIPIRFNNAVDVATDLGQVFAPGDAATGVRIVAIERLNSVLVVTRTPQAFQEVAEWVTKLDAPSSSSNLKTFVYQVENNTAVQIAQILAELFQDGTGLPSAAQTRTDQGQQPGGGGARPAGAGQQPTQQAGFTQGNRFNQQNRFGNQAAGSAFGNQGGGRGLGGSLGPQLSSAQSTIRSVTAGDVKIVVNEFNNSLIIQGTESDIQFILTTVKQLDTLPRQVIIEAKIYSVELNDNLSFGVNAFLQDRGTGLSGSDGGGTVLGPGQAATVGSITSGGLSLASRAFIGSDREIIGLIEALRNTTNVEVVEAPRLLATDGYQASINVGAEVPVTTASFGNPLTSGDTSFVNSIQFRSTGTTLLFIPRISAAGIVQMEVSIEVSTPTGEALTPTINRNYINTSLIIRDGQTAAIGGLISDSENDGKRRVPVLGDIPVIGALFGTTTKARRRAELIIFIKPRVIKTLPTMTELTLDFKRALRNSYDYINLKQAAEEQLIEERRNQELQPPPPE